MALSSRQTLSVSSENHHANSNEGPLKSKPTILSRKRKADFDNVMEPSPSFRRTGNNSPLNSNFVDGFATLMSKSENVNPAVQSHKQASASSSSTSSTSSRVPLGVLQTNSIRLAPSNKMTKSKNDHSSSKRRSRIPKSGRKIKLRESWFKFREFVNQPDTKASPSPFPALRFADKQDLWNVMCKKESGMYVRDANIMLRHENLQPRMRSILIDWLIEVSEVYKLHRETLYLAIDYLDRYLGSTEKLPRNKLQLIGVTCLFIASKIEEIYPPKLKEFAFVTDGACSEDEITQLELVVLKGLNWGLSPYTPNRWIKTFMQVNSLAEASNQTSASNVSEKFVMTQFKELDFLRAMQLMDLVVMDIGSLGFKYSVLAASVIYHCHDEQSALDASGYRWEDIAVCVEWMSPFVSAMRQAGIKPTLKTFSETAPEDYHNIQTHSVELPMLEEAQSRAQLIVEEMTRSRHSPDLTTQIYHKQETLMTPPADEKRSDAVMTPKLKNHIHQQSSVFLSPTSEAEQSGLW